MPCDPDSSGVSPTWPYHLGVAAAVETDSDLGNNSDEEETDVARVRKMVPLDIAGVPSLAIVAKEADETLGIIFLEAAGGGGREYSITSPGFRAKDLAVVPDFADTPSPELAVLGFGFGGDVVVNVVDSESQALLGSYPVAGDAGLALVRHAQRNGFDPGFTSNAEIDYAFAIPMDFTGIGSVPVLPVFVNAYVPPQPSMERCFAFGRALGDGIKALGLRAITRRISGLT